MRLLTLLCCFAGAAAGAVRLPAVFSDHMVVQAGESVAVWGWAEPSERVEVSLGKASASVETESTGRWHVRLRDLKASDQPTRLLVKGSNTIEIDDVLIGEVWVASGQSNMEMRLKDRMHGTVDGADEEVARAKFPQLRMFVHESTYSIYETSVPPVSAMDDCPGKWIVCSPETAPDLSAIAYYFGRDLHRSLATPVGILVAAVGGTPIEAWTSREAQERNSTLSALLKDWDARTGSSDPVREQAEFLIRKKDWLKRRAEATKAGQPIPKAPLPFKNQRVMTPGGLFNGMIAPLIPYTARGVVWYQGERNAAGPFTGLYEAQLRTLIEDWRARWGSDLFFAWVQLPGFRPEQKLPVEEKGWGVAVRDGMRRALAVPRTAMAITIDLGGPTAGHPTNKADYGARLSQVVLRQVYGKGTDPASGPLFESSTRRGQEMVLTFTNAQGLRPRSGELAGFAIAGADRKFVWAKARVEGDRIVVSHPSIPEPEAVRYGWASNPIGNLVNSAGIPASPFRTDNW